jgi:GNAT superfamily N-acetyltransferase
MTAINITVASASDGWRCNSFHNDHYGGARSLEQWRWEFVDPSENDAIPFCVATRNGTIVGTQALIPVPFIDERGVFLTAKSEETLVSPDMRGRDLLAALYQPLFKFAADRGYQSIWGFTPAARAFRKIGFETPGCTRQLFLSLEPAALAEAVIKSDAESRALSAGSARLVGVALWGWRKLCAGLARVRAPRLTAPDELRTLGDAELFDASLMERFVHRYGGATILRNREYMEWRVFRNPYRRAVVLAVLHKARLAGYLAFSIGDDRTGYLVDVVVAHPLGVTRDLRTLHVLLDAGIHRLARMGAKCIRGWSVTDHRFDVLVRKVARHHGFVLIRRGHDVVFTTNHLPHRRGTSHDDFRNWYVTRLFSEGTSG